MVAITSNKREHILGAVTQMYTQVANAPKREFHFPTGRRACEFVRYPADTVEGLPGAAVESFAGVGNPFAAGAIKEGDTVLDIGSGSGTDVLIAQRMVGPRGKVYALDMTAAMREKLQRTLDADGITNVEILNGNAESIPLDDACIDVVTSNGVLNLVPDKVRAIAEIFRVLKPGGRLQLADIALGQPVSARFKNDPDMWAECVVGAVSEDRYLDMLRAAGFDGVGIVDHLDYFSGSNSEKTREVAALFGAHSVVLAGVKPAGAELERVVAQQGSVQRRVAILGSQLLAVGGAGIAVSVCSGVPVLVAAFGAVGAAAFATHAYMFPVFVGFMALACYGIYREGRRRDNLAPFWVALAASVASSVNMWLMVTGFFILPLWTLFAGMGLLVAAGAWCLLLPLRADQCLRDMVRSVASRERPRRARLARGAALSLAAAAAFYGMYKSVDAFVYQPDPELEAFETSAAPADASCAAGVRPCPAQGSGKHERIVTASAMGCAEPGATTGARPGDAG